MKQRNSLTEEEHERLVEVGNWFWAEFSKLCAQAIAKMPFELEDLTKAYVQEHSSLYGSDYASYLPACRLKEGT